MLPLVVFWLRWLWNESLRCGLDWELWKSELRCKRLALDLTAAAPIEVAMLVWLVVTGAAWGALRRRPLESSFLCRALVCIGFLEPFGLLTSLAMIEELYVVSKQRQYFRSLPWNQLVVAYVSSNHFLFAAHTVLGKGIDDGSPAALRRVKSFCEEELAAALSPKPAEEEEAQGRHTVARLAGVGGMLADEARCAPRGFWHSLWSFNEHRLAGCWVFHRGMAVQRPCRLDHWLSLGLHVRKYSGHDIPAPLARAVLNHSLSIDNLVDCAAHSLSGIIPRARPRHLCPRRPRRRAPALAPRRRLRGAPRA